jgi:redox-sensitive bicupin YhaK (pirin superfamily)
MNRDHSVTYNTATRGQLKPESDRVLRHPLRAMITLRKAGDRFHTRIGWLDSHHTFSFAEHFDPRFMGFRSLRVINDDTVQPDSGFGTHSHRDMEIVTVVLDGVLQHRDSTGGGGAIRPGEVQRMSAGSGVRHSEMNPSAQDPVHFLQIWIVPEKAGIEPSYEQKSFPLEGRKNQLQLIASRDARDGSLRIHQDVALYAAVLDKGSVSYDLAPSRQAWVQVAKGNVSLNGQPLSAGDGASVSDERSLKLSGDGEVLLFDLA